MDALAVVLDDVVLVQLVCAGDRGSLPVAAPAGVRDVGLVDLRIRIGRRQDVVEAVAVAAIRRIGRVARQSLAVAARVEVDLHVVVTHRALHVVEPLRVVLAGVHVAVGAVEVGMYGRGEGLGIHVERNGHSPTFDLEAVVVVAHEADVVVCQRGWRGEEQEGQRGEENRTHRVLRAQDEGGPRSGPP